MNTENIFESLHWYGDGIRLEPSEHNLRWMAAVTISRLPEEIQDWLEDHPHIWIAGSGQDGEFMPVSVDPQEWDGPLVKLRIIYLSERLMTMGEQEVLFTIAHELAHSFLGHNDVRHPVGNKGEIEADDLCVKWGFELPPGRIEARDRCYGKHLTS